jgi:hypothetical protein
VIRQIQETPVPLEAQQAMVTESDTFGNIKAMFK